MGEGNLNFEFLEIRKIGKVRMFVCEKRNHCILRQIFALRYKLQDTNIRTD